MSGLTQQTVRLLPPGSSQQPAVRNSQGLDWQSGQEKEGGPAVWPGEGRSSQGLQQSGQEKEGAARVRIRGGATNCLFVVVVLVSLKHFSR